MVVSLSVNCFNLELGLSRKVSPSLYGNPEASLEVVTRSLRGPLVEVLVEDLRFIIFQTHLLGI